MISPVKVWRNQDRIRSYLGKIATILTWTEIFAPPSGFSEEAPYIVVTVEFESGGRYTAQLVDFDAKHLSHRQKVVAVLRRTRDPGTEGVIPYGVKFKPQ